MLDDARPVLPSARASEWPPPAATRSTCERRGWGGVRCCAERCGVGLKGAVATTKAAEVSTATSERSERARSATRPPSRRDWALEVVTVDTRSLTHKQATGALKLVTALSTITYKRAAEALWPTVAPPPATIYKYPITQTDPSRRYASYPDNSRFARRARSDISSLPSTSARVSTASRFRTASSRNESTSPVYAYTM